MLGLNALAVIYPGSSRPALRDIAAISRWQSTVLSEHPLVGTIWDARSARRVALDLMLEALRAAQHRLLGEVHDNPDHHAIQAEVLRAVGNEGLKPALALEQFDREFDPALRQLPAKVSAEDIAAAVRFERKGWNWDYYRPLIEIAQCYGMPLRATNLSRADARRIVKDGFSALGARKTALQIETAWSPEKEQTLREIIVESHCGGLPPHIVPGMAAAQRARDATMAEALLEAGPDGTVLIAGNGHVRRDLGVPLYLDAAATRGSVCAVGILEVEAGANDLAAYLKSAASNVLPFDFVYFTPRQNRPDPCAAFKAPGDMSLKPQ